ncbi:MAG: hypothetical protein ACYTEQ_16310 [Planctomycetota bacterium]
MLCNQHNRSAMDERRGMHADSTQMTREVYSCFVNVLGVDRDTSLGGTLDGDAEMVCACKKALHTLP